MLADQQCHCTTFFDFYGLPESLPGKNAVDANAPAQTLQKAFAEKLTEKIGANAMREKCPLFDSWLKNIEALA
ncbi:MULTISPECIES: DUF4276 family protein [Vibrio]|uniref:DUF4276 family protein n=1 Tax=Vibrio TaxID=662 RepID=UPI0004007734|nr:MULTISPECIES: DUF4276 family protein [Vibrio]MCG6278008.1 DUF4276 family protein [Vibrio vulnificus]MCR9941723.1 DUF4276 family protein [Vibrio owensii]CAH1536165.1 hypothetical protein VHARVF571_40012 [Vibrio harveyi]